MSRQQAELYAPLATWFEARFAARTAIQRKALPETLKGRNTLILAPTGSGKTLAAFLSALSSLAREAAEKGLPNAVRVVYVSPLRSLDRDIHRNLTVPLAVVNEGLSPKKQVRMEVRTGDTSAKERGRQLRNRPHLLLTTPESLSALLSQKGWAGGFDATTVIVDEIHAFAESKRGSLLALALERLEAQGGKLLQRIGLSATAFPVDVITRLLCGQRKCSVASVDMRKTHSLTVVVPPPEHWLPPAGFNPYRIAPTVADLVSKAQSSLVFVSTRSAAERLGLALNVLLPEHEDRLGVHHSAIDRRSREAIESGLSDGTMKAVVCSSSLEMGVDFQSVDQVLLIGTPQGVSRALQRLGRSGHRVDGVASGAVVPLSVPDVIQAIALCRAAEQGRLDQLKSPESPLDVLAQALLGMSIEREWTFDEAFKLVRRAGPFRELSRKDFDAVLDYLQGGGKVLGNYGAYGKIEARDGKFRVASAKVARDYYLNVGTISDDYQVKVVSRRNQRLGEVEERFIASLRPGEAFVIGGKPVALERMQGTMAVVKPASGERIQTPRWMGGKMPLTAQLAQEELTLRRDLRTSWQAGGRTACARILKRQWNAPDGAIQRVLKFLEHQEKAAPIPIDSPVQIERVREGRSLLILFHVVAGRAINRSLAWVVGYRMGVAGSIVANHDDRCFLLSMSPRDAPAVEKLREGFNPVGWKDDLKKTLEATETLGRSFRPVAETGQLIPRRTFKGPTPAKASSWNGSLLYSTLMRHDPDHPLLRETVREVMQDQMDIDNAVREAARIFEADWEVFDLPRPSPFALPLFAAFSRETLTAQDPDRALDELVAALYEKWEEEPVAVG